jgi:hypothetical protein
MSTKYKATTIEDPPLFEVCSSLRKCLRLCGKLYVANDFVDSRINEIIFYSNEKFKDMGYATKDGIMWDTEEYKIGLPFSPNINPSTWGGFMAHLVSSDAVCQFIGGAVATLQIKDGVMTGVITNETSRNSLLLHLGDNYIRTTDNGHNQILSTIKQQIHFSGEITK